MSSRDIKNTKKGSEKRHPIQCPYCGQKKGYDLVEHLESEDEVIKDQYRCPKCGKDAIRVYHFNRWESTD